MADLEKPLLCPLKIVFHYALDMSTFQHMINHENTRGMQRHWHHSQDDWSESWPGPQWAHVAPGTKHSSDNEQHADQYTEYFLAYDTTLNVNPLKVYVCLCFFFFMFKKLLPWKMNILTVSSLFISLTLTSPYYLICDKTNTWGGKYFN